ncbi:hypothetical protein F3Y22_tig00014408pilonHSYRG00001 [Hibiscus syriacus]|uniref:Uncharacterized protein n=1 Tax=Hibiscus syriacus TaxID=106335 RepID=A0A6A3BZB4_HIBSY|nr:hypothetical protein F3Y22_tig00014408pilonHSYRG00001 [Hibiscus syriacus]
MESKKSRFIVFAIAVVLLLATLASVAVACDPLGSECFVSPMPNAIPIMTVALAVAFPGFADANRSIPPARLAAIVAAANARAGSADAVRPVPLAFLVRSVVIPTATVGFAQSLGAAVVPIRRR